MEIKSLVTDYLCHLTFSITSSYTGLKYEITSWWGARCYDKAVKKGRKKLSAMLSNKSNKKEYKKLTNKEPINKHDKYTSDYRDWIEENKGE